MDFSGNLCPVCKKEFTKNDDVVVCAECGTPCHRECYKKDSRCANFEKHGTGFSFVPAKKTEKPSTSGKLQTPANLFGENAKSKNKITCINCGRENPKAMPFCLYCGTPLKSENSNFGENPFIDFKAAGISPDEKIGETTANETAYFIGTGAKFYLPKFIKEEKNGKKLSWNFAAFFFSPYWFFFRKMQLFGFIVMLCMLILTGVCTSKRVLQAENNISKHLIEVYQTKGDIAPVQKEVKDFMNLWENRVYAAGLVSIHIICGLLGNTLYLRHVKKKIPEIKKSDSNLAKGGMQLYLKGGVSISMTALSLMGYYSLSQLLLRLLIHFIM